MNKVIIVDKQILERKIKQFINERDALLFATSKELYSLFRNKIDNILKIYNCRLILISNFRLDDAMELSRALLTEHFNKLIAFGGGTINDVCKMASKYSDATLISIPTIVSNDGVCSNISVLRIDDIRTDGFASKSPDVVLIDIDIIKNAPSMFFKAGICDILSNYSAVWDWDLAVLKGVEQRNDLARIMSSNAFWSLFNLPDNIEEDLKIKLVCESIVMSGLAMEIKGNTRPCSGSEHLFNHAMVAYYPEIKVLHGYLVGLGSLASCILQKQNFNKLVSFLKRNDIDVRPSTLGITKTVFVDAWKKAKDTRPNRYTILNEVELNDKILESIYDKIEKEAY